MSLAAGTRLDNYEILCQLGVGGMGEVWLARDLRLERQVALKILPSELTTDPARVKRFEQEARAASALNHPNVCTIYALGVANDGRHVIAMEYVQGETVRARLGRGVLDQKALLDIGVQVASGLTAAHAAGVIHRDLKPENVMLRPDGFVKVLDFGLAKLVDAESDPALATRTVLRTDPGTAVGTVAYMSPEQARGQPLDPRTDVWSLGVLLYEMVAGRRPFARESTSDALAAILEHDPEPLSRFDAAVPHELQRIVSKALRKDREQRYQGMKDLVLDLQALRDDLVSGERSAGASAARGEPSRTSVAGQSAVDHVTGGRETARRWRRLAGLTVVAAVLASGAWLWYARIQTGRATRSAKQTEPAMLVDRPLTKLTTGAGLQTDVTWSPDGRFIAYASDRAGNFDIWVQPVGDGDAVQITKEPSQETQPDWSPDGSTIVYHSDRRGGGVYAIPALGGAERQLASFGTFPRWSPNGNDVFILRQQFVEVGPGPVQLYAVGPGGGEAVPVLTDFLARGRHWYWVGSHPDGRISALGWERDLGFGFFTVPRKGGRPVSSKLPENFPLRTDDLGLTTARFQWNATGTGLWFELPSNGIPQLWKAVVDPTTLDVVSMERLTSGPSRDTRAAWSRDGTRLAYTAENQTTRLWIYPFDPVRGRVTSEGRAVTEEDAKPCCVDLSLDGRHLLYGLSHGGREGGELWLADLVQGTRELVTRSEAPWGWLGGALSRDGSTVAYARLRFVEHAPTESLPMLYRAGGGQQSYGTLPAGLLFFPYGWTPDGRELVGSIVPGDNPAAAWFGSWPLAAPISGGRTTRVLVSEHIGSIWQGRVSPDGRWVTFVVTPQSNPGHVETFIAPFDRPTRDRWIRVAADHEWPDKPRWAPDGRTLFFVSRRPGAYFNLWGVRFDTSAGRLLGEPFMITNMNTPGFAIAPDMSNTEIQVAQRHVVLTMQTTTGNIWTIANADK